MPVLTSDFPCDKAECEGVMRLVGQEWGSMGELYDIYECTVCASIYVVSPGDDT